MSNSYNYRRWAAVAFLSLPISTVKAPLTWPPCIYAAMKAALSRWQTHCNRVINPEKLRSIRPALKTTTGTLSCCVRALLLCDCPDQSSICESDVTVGVAAGHVRCVSGTAGNVTLKFSIALKSPAVVSRFPSDGKLKISSANRNTEANST
jgi:hypothetical protein